MNKIYWPSGKGAPLSDQQLIRAARDLAHACRTELHPSIENDPLYARERVTGNLCDCDGNGEFVLEPVGDCINGGKRYMKCRVCGKFSHL